MGLPWQVVRIPGRHSSLRAGKERRDGQDMGAYSGRPCTQDSGARGASGRTGFVARTPARRARSGRVAVTVLGLLRSRTASVFRWRVSTSASPFLSLRGLICLRIPSVFRRGLSTSASPFCSFAVCIVSAFPRFAAALIGQSSLGSRLILLVLSGPCWCRPRSGEMASQQGWDGQEKRCSENPKRTRVQAQRWAVAWCVGGPATVLFARQDRAARLSIFRAMRRPCVTTQQAHCGPSLHWMAAWSTGRKCWFALDM